MMMLFQQGIAITHQANTHDQQMNFYDKKCVVSVHDMQRNDITRRCSSVMSHTGGKEGTYPGTRPAQP